jgi:two-component sensor histidine kinase
MSIGRFKIFDGEPPSHHDDSRAETGHRFANSLAVLAARIRFHARGLPPGDSMPTEEVRALLAGIAARVGAVGRLHRLLMSRDGAVAIDLTEYLAQIAAAVAAAFTDGRPVEIATDLQASRPIAVKDAEVVGSIVAEALINALKHAAGAEVGMRSRRDERGALIIEIADAGPGLPAGWDERASARKRGGIALMRLLARSLGSELTFDQSAGGLRVRLVLRGLAQ